MDPDFTIPKNPVVLGKGSFGIVYAVNGNRLAAKHVKRNDDDLNESPLKEVKVLQKLDDAPNVLQLIKHKVFPNKVVIVTLRYEGTLTLLMKEIRNGVIETAMTPEHQLSIVKQLCSGLQACHERGVILRDIKPENVLVNYTDPSNRKKLKDNIVLVLSDLGAAYEMEEKLLQEEKRAKKTHSDEIWHYGTITYRPPETFEWIQYEPNTFLDIWALGVCIAEVYYGERLIYNYSERECWKGYDKEIADFIAQLNEEVIYDEYIGLYKDLGTMMFRIQMFTLDAIAHRGVIKGSGFYINKDVRDKLVKVSANFGKNMLKNADSNFANPEMYVEFCRVFEEMVVDDQVSMMLGRVREFHPKVNPRVWDVWVQMMRKDLKTMDEVWNKIQKIS
jgi:serine/threonine protein kinase